MYDGESGAGPATADGAPPKGPTPRKLGGRTLSLPARADQLPRLRRFVEQAASDFGFGADGQFAITVAVNEAVTNAIEHGGDGDESVVRVDVSVDGDALCFLVHDRGHGLLAARPRASFGQLAADLAHRGRGLPFMAAMMDAIELRRGRDGTVICLSKRLDSPAFPAA